MAELDKGLFRDVERYLRPYLITKDQRAVTLTHLLSQWRGRTSLRWEAPADAFTAELVDLLPNTMLVDVLRAVGEGQGLEQRQAAEELCVRVDAEGALVHHGPLPAVSLKPAPARLPVDGGSVLFLPPDPAADPETPLSVDDVRAMWREPIALVTDFPLDAEQSLAALADSTESVLWIAGESLLDPDLLERFASADDARALADLPPGLLIVDFSGVRPGLPATGAGRAVAALLAWAESKGHRVALGLPRHVLPHLDLDSPRTWPVCTYRAAELFSRSYAHRAEHCEKLLKATLPLREALFPLLSANSASLPHEAAHLLGGSRWRHRGGSDEIALAMRLAKGLATRGFYEIAYRLEVYCRMRSARDGSVPLAADLWPPPPRSDEKEFRDFVVGFVASTSDLPARVRRAALTGGSGTGKTTALVDIEHRWSVPRNGDTSAWTVPYLPLYVALTADTVTLDRGVGDHLGRDEFRWFRHGDERVEMACHTLVAALGSLEVIRHLFSSPVLLLLDDADQVPAHAHEEFARELAAVSNIGLLVASRGGRLTRALRLGEARIRELDEQQVSQFLDRRRGHPSLVDLLATHHRPIGRHIRNPRLLGLLCDLGLAAADLKNANLKTIVERFVACQADGGDPAWAADGDIKRLLAWLPSVAYELLTTGGPRRARTEEERTLIADGALLGLLRRRADRELVEFAFEALRDFFAAQSLAAEVSRSGVGAVLERNRDQLAADDLPKKWRDVCRMLVAMLRGRDARRLVELLGRFDPRLAHECALELPADGQIGATTARTLVRRLTSARTVDERVTDARALGVHDPRIHADAPLDGMVEVPASERMGSYHIGRYPVTTMEFAGFVAAGGYRSRELWNPVGWAWVQRHRIAFPRYWRNHLISQPNHPVTGVNFFEASAYCAWLSGRNSGIAFTLPTALEWDRAAHADDDRVFQLVLDIADGTAARTGTRLARHVPVSMPPTGGPFEDPRIVGTELSEEIIRTQHLASVAEEHLAPHEEQLRHEDLTPVGLFARNHVGIHDLFGGVWQWCNTTIAQMSQTERHLEDLAPNSSVAAGVPVVVKGGGGSSGLYNPVWLLIGGWFDPLVRSHRLGFRLTCRPRSGR